jgi:hypothetical protein
MLVIDYVRAADIGGRRIAPLGIYSLASKIMASLCLVGEIYLSNLVHFALQFMLIVLFRSSRCSLLSSLQNHQT